MISTFINWLIGAVAWTFAIVSILLLLSGIAWIAIHSR